MPITLAQAAVNTAPDVNFEVIDNFRRNSWLMDHIVFDDTVTPATGGASLTYAYVRKLTGASAAPRAINTEYVPGKATTSQVSNNLIPMGGSFEVDRVLNGLGPAQTAAVQFQLMELLIAVRERFVRELLYGDTSVDPNTFNGLSKALTGSVTELTTSTSWTGINTQALALAELDKIDIWLSSIVASSVGSMTDGQPGAIPPGVRAILGNTRSITRLKTLIRWASTVTVSKDNFDQDIDNYRGYALIDLGDRADGASPIIPITANVTELYAVSLGLDAVHGATAAGKPLVQSWLPDFTTAGAVKTGEVEMGPVAFVLKNSKAAGVYRNITV